MKTGCLIVPYFGKLPSTFRLFLRSCKYNINYDWLIITDCKYNYEVPENVRIIYMKFEELRELIGKKYDFEIALTSPYKLCDFRPAYGDIFREYLKEYRFWGYCDIDLFWGNIDKFITKDILANYDKIGHLGHFALFRNNDEMRYAYLSEFEGVKRYKDVFSTGSNLIFDEWHEVSMNGILLELEKKIYYLSDFVDIYPYKSYFVEVIVEPITSKNSFGKGLKYVEWQKGSIFSVDIIGRKKEQMYAHFQKRDLRIDDTIYQLDKFICFPNEIVTDKEFSESKAIIIFYFHMLFDLKYIKRIYIRVRYKVVNKVSSILRFLGVKTVIKNIFKL